MDDDDDIVARPEILSGVVFEVENVEQARIAEDAGACAVVVSPSAGNHRREYPSVTRGIKRAVKIPVIGRCQYDHRVEAQILEAIGVDYIDEDDCPAPDDQGGQGSWGFRYGFAEPRHDMWSNFRTPFVYGFRGAAEAAEKVAEGTVGLVRNRVVDLKPRSGHSGCCYEIEKKVTRNMNELREFYSLDLNREDEVPWTRKGHRLPVGFFAAGKGIETPADAALMMQSGCDGVFVGSQIFKDHTTRPITKRVRAMVLAVAYFDDPRLLASLG